jgi:hypothetical protein
MHHFLTIGRRRFHVSLVPLGANWQWILAAPGIVLSGEKPTSSAVLRSARQAGRTLARLDAA